MTRIYCGIDLGGTSAKLALGDSTGKIIASDSFSTQSDGRPDAVIASIEQHVQKLLRKAGADSLAGLGMGVPGLVDVQEGETRFLPNLPTQWRDIPVARNLSRVLDCPVRLMNDVRTATLGELRFGSGKDSPRDSFAFFSIGTGIGGGIVIDGKLRLGPLGAAGELGHQTMLPDGPRCGCGNRGCLETLSSGPAIAAEGMRLMRMGLAPRLHALTGGATDRVTAKEMALAAAEDPLIDGAIERAFEFLGIAAANVVTVLHPDRIVLGGGVSEIGDRLHRTVKRVISERVGMFPTARIRVICSPLGERAGLQGALALAIASADD
ncbi:ROK family protein [Roseiconus nitratireducens]|uniref:ROK family protein n=1 Tax=Roseiconus nitratireducens TaxID=2605748 RepID=A0A5M6D0D9_9BACT|nr:ROK family protein [Roseiconus nitratireducens]KAA5540526.1 ROK family protein [Roseiconus nitratireducens]